MNLTIDCCGTDSLRTPPACVHTSCQGTQPRQEAVPVPGHVGQPEQEDSERTRQAAITQKAKSTPRVSRVDLMYPPQTSCIKSRAHVSRADLMYQRYTSCIKSRAHVSRADLMYQRYNSCIKSRPHVSRADLLHQRYTSCIKNRPHVSKVYLMYQE